MTPPATLEAPTTGAPQRTRTQRLDALERANEVRTKRAQLKREVKAGRITFARLLARPPEYIHTMKVMDLLLHVPKYGRVKAYKALQQCRVAPSKTIGGLTDRQRLELVALIRAAAEELERARAHRLNAQPRGRIAA